MGYANSKQDDIYELLQEYYLIDLSDATYKLCGYIRDANAMIKHLIKKEFAQGEDGYDLTPTILDRIVLNNNQHRYKFNTDKSKIRALQGHSIPVDLELLPQVPPKFLYHCTSFSSKEAIYIDGILKDPRQYVRLSANIETSSEVGTTHDFFMSLADSCPFNTL